MAPNLKCPECDAGADPTKDGEWAHCASCNNIFQPGNITKADKGEGKADGNGEEKKAEEEAEAGGNGKEGGA